MPLYLPTRLPQLPAFRAGSQAQRSADAGGHVRALTLALTLPLPLALTLTLPPTLTLILTPNPTPTPDPDPDPHQAAAAEEQAGVPAAQSLAFLATDEV